MELDITKSGGGSMSATAEFQLRLLGICGQRAHWKAGQVEAIAQHISKRHGVSAASLLATAPLPVPAPSQRRAAELVLKDAAADGRTFHFIASTAEIDRMGDTIAVEGWQLSAFKRNPVILGFHNSGSLPVGKATSIGVQSGKLMVRVKFASTGLGKTMASMGSSGFMTAVSVGFAPIKYSFSTDPARSMGIDFKQQELLEISVVPVPANASALLTGISGNDGKMISAPKAKARRARELEIIKLRLPPLDAKDERRVTLARMRAK